MEVFTPSRTEIVNEDKLYSFFKWRTILFNCNCHSFDQVIRQLDKAIHCGEKKGAEIAENIDKNGQATVYTGHRERAEHIGEILSSIGLRTDVCKDAD